MDIDVTEVIRPPEGNNVAVYDRSNGEAEFCESDEEGRLGEITNPMDDRLQLHSATHSDMRPNNTSIVSLIRHAQKEAEQVRTAVVRELNYLCGKTGISLPRVEGWSP